MRAFTPVGRTLRLSGGRVYDCLQCASPFAPLTIPIESVARIREIKSPPHRCLRFFDSSRLVEIPTVLLYLAFVVFFGRSKTGRPDVKFSIRASHIDNRRSRFSTTVQRTPSLLRSCKSNPGNKKRMQYEITFTYVQRNVKCLSR